CWQHSGNQMLTNRAEIPSTSPPTTGGKQRLCTVDSLDQRTRGAKRVAELVTTFEAGLGRTPTAAESAAIRNAALLSALSEAASARRLDGDSMVSFEDIVRLSRAAQAATRGLVPLRGQRKAEGPSLGDLLSADLARQAPVGVPSVPPAPDSRPATQ